MENKKVVYYLATEENVDHVARRVYEVLEKGLQLEELEILVDGKPVMRHVDENNCIFDFVRTDRVVCHDYRRYLPIMKERFSDYHVAGLITWHEGENAPDGILSVHTTGDVETGSFGKANPRFMHNLLVALEKNRRDQNLVDFFVTTEATHWSGIVYGDIGPEAILEYEVPIMDIEIGSGEESWKNENAVRALAMSLLEIFEDDGLNLRNILCVGGTHFERGFSGEVFKKWDGCAFGISHIIPNQWLVSGEYENESGIEKLRACVDSIEGGIHGIAMHDGLKGAYKQQLRNLGEALGIPVFKHQFLRKPEEVKW
ncbi:D-aminoacyl-tRNA deacylase [Gudongella sp. SC589]|jgi:D-tyrosyl-tRNA(Tyr) deacylase|uniref:D-aminoacyl-tRNA deacylase n=1 Tax=Gudongella sp. SC589 TaxID=3385990 RepID=UPI0039048F98